MVGEVVWAEEQIEARKKKIEEDAKKSLQSEENKKRYKEALSNARNRAGRR